MSAENTAVWCREGAGGANRWVRNERDLYNTGVCPDTRNPCHWKHIYMGVYWKRMGIAGYDTDLSQPELSLVVEILSTRAKWWSRLLSFYRQKHSALVFSETCSCKKGSVAFGLVSSGCSRPTSGPAVKEIHGPSILSRRFTLVLTRTTVRECKVIVSLIYLAVVISGYAEDAHLRP